MDFEDIEIMKKAKQAAAGTALYRYPGELLDSDEDYHAADIEDGSKKTKDHKKRSDLKDD